MNATERKTMIDEIESARLAARQIRFLIDAMTPALRDAGKTDTDVLAVVTRIIDLEKMLVELQYKAQTGNFVEPPAIEPGTEQPERADDVRVLH